LRRNILFADPLTGLLFSSETGGLSAFGAQERCRGGGRLQAANKKKMRD